MRIATISYHGCPLAAPGSPSTGGMQVYVRELSRALAAQGHQVDIYTRRTSPDVPTIVNDRPGVRVIHLNAGPEAPIDKHDLSFHLPEFVSQVRRFHEGSRAQYDVVHSHYWLSGRIGRLLAPRWHVPHVTMFHTLGEIKNRAKIGERESDERLRSERTILSEADRIIVASPHERAQLLRFYGLSSERIRVVPCGVDLDRFRPLDKQTARDALAITEPYVLLFVGRLEPLKGVEILINAAAGLDERDRLAVLLVGGRSDGHPLEQARLQNLANEVGLGEQVRFLGGLSQDRLPVLYNAADVTVVPSYYESFGLVAVESLACGTPVVASRVGGLTSTIRDGETGFLVPWRCPEAFGERIELLLGNDTLREHFAQQARPSVERFDWARIAGEITTVYQELQTPETARAVR